MLDTTILNLITNKEIVRELVLEGVLHVHSPHTRDDYNCITIDVEYLLELTNIPQHVFNDSDFLINLEQERKNTH